MPSCVQQRNCYNKKLISKDGLFYFLDLLKFGSGDCIKEIKGDSMADISIEMGYFEIFQGLLRL
jgi:hypothetical protein